MTHRVDLANYNSVGIRVYAGRDRGEAVRKAARLDELDTAEGPVIVVIPADVFSVNSSFFLGMFGPSIRLLGEERFRHHYRFEGADLELLVEDSIRQATRTSSPLPRSGGQTQGR